MNKGHNKAALNGLGWRLIFSFFLPLLIAMTLLFTIQLLAGAAEGGGADISLLSQSSTTLAYANEDEHSENLNVGLDGAEATWEELLWEIPQEQKIILIHDPYTDLLEENITTGTNDFNITIRRDVSGSWRVTLPDNEIIEPIPGKSEREYLLSGLEREWEFKMPIPDEVLEKLKDGYKVGVAVTDAKEENLMGGTNAEEVWKLMNSDNLIEGVPGDPIEARKFLHEKRLTLGDLHDSNSMLTITELFDLEKSGGSLQCKLADEYLYIKGYPKIQIREDFYYSNIIGDLQPIPLVYEFCGGSSHMIYSQKDLTKPVGSTSTIVYDVNVLKKNPDETVLQKELAICEGASYLHFSQIQNQNAQGYLKGYKDGEKPFWFLSWGDGFGKPYLSDKMRIGNGKEGSEDNFAAGGAIGLWFWYPLELTFYLAGTEDVAVQDIDYGELEPGSTATATVTVYRAAGRDDDDGDGGDYADDEYYERRSKLHFIIPGIIDETVEVSLKRDETKDVSFTFTTPANGVLVMTAEINPEPRAFEETTYENNILTVTAMINMLEYGDLPYWVLSKKLHFTTPAAIAELILPKDHWWAGNAVGELNVHNSSTDLYRDFTANGQDGNSISIPINQASARISKRALITATLKREDFGDRPHDPISPYYADNGLDLLRTGLINTGGDVSRRAGYLWYCDGHGTRKDGSEKPCTGHVAYTYIEASFSDIEYEEEYTANVYNGMEKLPYRKMFDPKAQKSSEKYKFDLGWEGTHYNFDVVRWMCHLDEANKEYGWEPVDGQYERTFIGQSTGAVTWKIEESMADFYKADRKAATDRKTGKGNYKHAVFATDKLLQGYDWPIKSGYYFNPGGTYTCTVHTEQYKDTPGDTEEHKELVKAVREAFIYNSSLVYVNKNQQEGRLGDITEKGDVANTHGLLAIKEDFSNYTAEKHENPLFTSLEREKAVNTDELFKEVMEGYLESETVDSAEYFKYREQTDKKIWLVKEETVIEFTVGIPPGDSRNLYTHVNMKNGEYLILAKVDAIKFEFEHNKELTMGEFNLDGIKVTVSGSMYDDR